MRGTTAKSKLLTTGLVFICSFTLLYFITVADNAIHADEVSVLLVAKDIFQNGNFLLKGWNLSTGLFMLPTWSIGLWGSIFGYSYTLLYILSAVHYALLVTALSYIAGNAAHYYDWKISIITALLLIIPRSQSVLNAGTQTLAYMAVAVILYATYIAINKQGVVFAVIIVVAAGFLMITNTVMPYYILMPVIGLACYKLYCERKFTKKSITLSLMALGEAFIWQAGYRIWIQIRGSSFDSIKEVFVAKEMLLSNAVQVVSNILEEFGISVWGENLISLATVRAVVGAIVLGTVLILIKRYYKYCERNELAVLFIFASMTSLLAYGLSTLPAYSASTHLMEPFGLYLCAAFGIIICNQKGINYVFMGGLAAVYVLISMPPMALRPQRQPTQAVSDYLVQRGLVKGFATYWEATPLMFESNGELTLAPISVYYNPDVNQDGSVIGVQVWGWKWMAKDEWMQQEGNYIVIAKDNPYGITVDMIYKDYGAANEMVELDNYYILIWNEPFTLMGACR